MGNMKMKKWDPDRHCYEPHSYPDEWRVSFYCADMDELDYKGVYMTYVMCSFMGIKATIVQGNTLTEPYPLAKIPPDRIWKTPAKKGMLL